VGALLDHHGAGGVVGNNRNSAVLNARFLNDLMNIDGDVMEGGDPATGLQLNFLLNHFKFHNKILLNFICLNRGYYNKGEFYSQPFLQKCKEKHNFIREMCKLT
jgi:hypothetical protein